ncbi:MAG: TylF/MycF/NovP-related O-methyltransferase, partial [Nitrospirales bacterium]|nr:TylF/MycF/NovP-related O-methyltransferase [Nitrospirales bacterium]
MKHLRKLVDFLVGAGSAASSRDMGTANDAGMVTDAQLAQILATVKPFTMVHESGVRFTVEQALRLIQQGIPGAFVECGVWRGGCSLAMLLAQRLKRGRVERPVYMLDSFEGLPPVTPRDGPLALQWKQGDDPANYFDNCTASIEELKNNLGALGFGAEDYRICPGWFKDTLPRLAEQLTVPGIALLRLDGDWYDSTLACLESLVPLVSEGGIVI